MKLTFPTPAANEPSKRANAFFDAIQETFGYLYSRWLDEHQHEDINDYKLPLLKVAVDHDVQILKMTKKPFGFHFVADSREYKVKTSGRYIQYQRVK